MYRRLSILARSRSLHMALISAVTGPMHSSESRAVSMSITLQVLKEQVLKDCERPTNCRVSLLSFPLICKAVAIRRWPIYCEGGLLLRSNLKSTAQLHQQRGRAVDVRASSRACPFSRYRQMSIQGLRGHCYRNLSP